MEERVAKEVQQQEREKANRLIEEEKQKAKKMVADEMERTHRLIEGERDGAHRKLMEAIQRAEDLEKANIAAASQIMDNELSAQISQAELLAAQEEVLSLRQAVDGGKFARRGGARGRLLNRRRLE